MSKKITVLTEIIIDSNFLNPYDTEAWDMWGKVKGCHQRLYIQYGKELGEMNTWDCYQTFCQDCEEVSGKFKGKVKFGKVNIEDAQTLAQKFGVSTIPNFILFKDGKVVNNFIGGMSAEELSEKLEKHI